MSRNLKFDLNVETNALFCPNPIEFYTHAYISEDIVNNFRTLPGIKSATKLSNVLFTDMLKASTCNFSAGTQDLDAIDIDVCALSAMAELCQFDLEQSYESMNMAKGSNNGADLPGSFRNYYFDEMSKEIQQEVSILRWRGNTGGTSSTFLDLCDGYQTKFAADAAIIDVVGTTVTTANVLAEMVKVYQASVTASQGELLSRPADFRFYISSNVAAAFKFAAASGNTLAYITQNINLTFLDVPIVVQPGMSSNRMALSNKNNMIYAFDAEGDGKPIKIIDMDYTTAEPLLRSRVNIKVGFHYTNPTEIVYYS